MLYVEAATILIVWRLYLKISLNINSTKNKRIVTAWDTSLFHEPGERNKVTACSFFYNHTNLSLFWFIMCFFFKLYMSLCVHVYSWNLIVIWFKSNNLIITKATIIFKPSLIFLGGDSLSQIDFFSHLNLIVYKPHSFIK